MKKIKRIYTKGNIEVQNIKIGDVHYEYGYGFCIKSKVISKPIFIKNEDDSIYWTWKSKNVTTNQEIDYGVTEDMAHYGPNLYNYEAYLGCRFI